MKLCEQRRGADHLEVAKLLRTLGIVYANLYKLEDAVQSFRRGLDICQNQVKPNNVLIAKLQVDLGSCYVKLKRFTEAEILLKRALIVAHEQVIIMLITK